MGIYNSSQSGYSHTGDHMPGANEQLPLLRFGLFEMDLRTGELRKSGALVHLEPQPYKVLALLAGKAGTLVTQEEIHQHIWGQETFVDYEQGLRFAVKKIRAALGDRSESPRYIETLPRRGYRFIAPVERVQPATDGSSRLPTASPALSRPLPAVKNVQRRTRWIIAVAMVAILAVVFGLNLARFRIGLLRLLSARPSSPNIHSIAVLPLENLSRSQQQEYFADGMTEELITDLSKLSALRVISRTSVMAYKGSKKNLRQIARELNVDAVVEGSVEREGNRVRITAQLIDASTDRNIWAETYDGDLKDVLALQSQVAEAIAQKIRLRMTPQERQRIAAANPINPEAYDAYELGQYHLHRGTIADLHKAIDDFKQAIGQKPDYARAYLGIAESYAHMSPGFLPPSATMPNASAFAMKALKLDNHLAQAHAMLGGIHLAYDWQWARAENEIERALELDANSSLAHEIYAAYYAALSQGENAAREMHQAQELDPISRGAGGVAARCWILYMARDYDMSAKEVARDLEIDPKFGFGHAVLGLIALERGQRDRALSEAREGVRLQPNPFALEILGVIEAKLGMLPEASDVIRTLKRRAKNEYICRYELGAIYASLGDRDAAFRYLNKACDDRDKCMIWLKSDPRLTELHSDPRFQALTRRVNFPR